MLMPARVGNESLGQPPFRRLRVYAFDPSLDTQLETAVINQATLKVPWECDPDTGGDVLGPGPVGEYLEVVDVDPASGCFYRPVDLNDPYLLAQDGLPPSEGNPQFHQQMVYAVAMATIRNFERALGRLALWAPQRLVENGRVIGEEYVRRLRIYPHALREANAYYSPEKKALLFGYFPASPADPGQHLPGGTVFSCLSHDVVAHETTHALLDGMHRRFIEPSNPDMLAFHEAFADIVALFQHFTSPEVLRHQIARTRGYLARQNLLGQLAQEFGQATGSYGALRDALGQVNPQTRQWEPKPPDPTEIDRTFEPHARGSLLVAAVFDAFLSIYKSRIADLLRIATSGTGVLPEGEIHPDLVNRLADEAAKSAQHVLNICIRALDYCPPVDLTFGEYLRALITADYDLVRDDDRGYRIAFIEAFRRRGIYPRDVRTLSVDSLRWQCSTDEVDEPLALPFVKEVAGLSRQWDLSCNRKEIYNRARRKRAALHDWIEKHLVLEEKVLMGLDLGPNRPPIEVHSLRPTRRIGPDGQSILELVVEITQRRPCFWSPGLAGQDPANPDFWFRGGCTLLVDLETGFIRYCIVKHIDSEQRLQRQRAFLQGGATPSLRATYFGGWRSAENPEPFAFLHRPSGEMP
jgi:quinol monooxygenase YgiN